MIERLKTLSKIGVEVSSLKDEVKGLKDSIRDLKDGLKDINEDVKGFVSVQKELALSVEDSRRHIPEIQSLNKELKDEIYGFKLLKSDMQKKIISKFESELKKELEERFSQFRHDAQRYSDLRKEIEIISKQAVSLSSEIEKFNTIAKSIKSQDFSLVAHKKNLEAMDKEKLMLMKRIDGLERLVSKLRRSR